MVSRFECINAANALLSLTHMHGSKFSVKFCNGQPLFTLSKVEVHS